MSAIVPSSTLAELVVLRPELASRLDAFGLDYCCGGDRPLSTAVDEAGLDLDVVVADLAATPAVAADEPSWSGAAELVDWIESTHHAYLRRTLPWLTELAEKVRGVHGERHPELSEVAALVGALRADLEPHLLKEERVLFPMIRALFGPGAGSPSDPDQLAAPIRVMRSEHEEVGALLARLRACADQYRAPDDGCASYDALYAGLADLEADTHRHVHLENNVLFPALLAAESAHERRDALDEGGESPCWAHLVGEADELAHDGRSG